MRILPTEDAVTNRSKIRMMKRLGLWMIGSVAILGLSCSGAIASVNQIGVAAAVKNKADAVIGTVVQPLTTGAALVQDETVRTGPADTAQLLFIDQTSLSVGPKSEVKLDCFVFDPARAKGDVVLDVSKGVFRFVSGSQDPHSYALKTPVATIGVRGTIVDFMVENGRLTIILVEGWSEITLSDGSTVRLTEPGTAIVIGADGNVDGPKAWDGSFHNIIQVTSFPLYGHAFEQDENDPDLGGGDMQELADELATHNIDIVGAPNIGDNDGDEDGCDFIDECVGEGY